MNNRRVLVFGSNGLLGQKVAELLVRGTPASVTLTSFESTPVRPMDPAEYVQADITSKKEVKGVVAHAEPDVIINCAAITNVDACETERETAWKVNVGGVEHIIEAARRTGAMIVHVSSDYIFDGKNGPYTEDDRPEPLSYYGKTKLASENSLRASGMNYLIARTMILYGFAPGVKQNFALWLIGSLEKQAPVRIVDDQFGNPTLADDLAYGLLRGVELGKTGIYNIAGRDIVSRHEFALRIARAFSLDPSLISTVKTAQLRQPAHRPLKSGLITLKAEVELGIHPSTIEQGLAVLKNQISRGKRRAADSGPVPGQPHGRGKH
ncbi:MAG TPA: dTDP-4-dehydrorhamnose reductase [Bacteroidota bacterium]|nr:dTDP-4-dehydrorhamnose reductase [Bacteroidota bacterium]